MSTSELMMDSPLRVRAAAPPAVMLEHEALTALAVDDFAAARSIASSPLRDRPVHCNGLRCAELRRLLYAGALDEARRAGRAALRGPGLGASTSAFAHVVLSRVATEQHLFPEAQQHVRSALSTAGTPVAPSLERELRIARGRLAAACGEAASALWWITPLLQRPRSWSPLLVLEPAILPWAVRTAIEAGTPGVTAQLMAWAGSFATQTSECRGLAIALEQARALLAADTSSLVKAAEDLAQGPRLLARAEAHEDAASAFVSMPPAVLGAKLQASTQFRLARDLYEVTGARLGERRVQARLSRLREGGAVRRTGAPREGWESLSSTELTVAERAAEGLTNRQIGEVLFMSRYTVDTHLRHIFAKLSLNSRVDLAGVVRQHHEQLAGALAPSPSHPAVGPAGTSGAAGVEVRAGRGFPASVAVQQ